MNSRTWIVLTIATIVALGAANVVIAGAIDPYGVWRDPHGRQLPIAVITTGRKAKFLLSQRYVPANYDGLVIGTSSVANWDVTSLDGARIYNLGISGADVSEEKMVLDQALRQGHYKIAVCALSPSFTKSHEVKSGLDSTSKAESLASIHLYIQEASYLLRSTHHGSGHVDIAANGYYEHLFNRGDPQDLRFPKSEPSDFNVDPVAVQQFGEMVDELRRQGALVVYVFPLVYEPFLQRYNQFYTNYLHQILPLVPKAPIIDFNGPQYTYLRSDPDNFMGVVHLNPVGTKKFVALLKSSIENIQNNPGESGSLATP